MIPPPGKCGCHTASPAHVCEAWEWKTDLHGYLQVQRSCTPRQSRHVPLSTVNPQEKLYLSSAFTARLTPCRGCNRDKTAESCILTIICAQPCTALRSYSCEHVDACTARLKHDNCHMHYFKMIIYLGFCSAHDKHIATGFHVVLSADMRFISLLLSGTLQRRVVAGYICVAANS